MKQRVLKVHPEDNIIVALDTLNKGETISYGSFKINLIEDISPKHKFTE